MRRVLRHQALDRELELLGLKHGHAQLDLAPAGLHPVGVRRGVRCEEEDARVGRGLELLVLVLQLLEELLARTQADELDLDVLARTQAAELDELAREVHDLHGLAHIEDVDAAVLAEHGSLEHQAHRLRNRHEVPRHVRMRHRHRPARRDLPLEDRDHAARRPQHVAEADGDEAGRPRCRQVIG